MSELLNCNLPPRSLECPSCLEYMHGTIFLCRNGHSLCGNCRKSLRNCPICRGNFSTVRNFAMEILMDDMEFPCMNAAHGCGSFVRKIDAETHAKNCLFRRYACKILKADGTECNWKGSASALHTHTTTVHAEFSWMQEDNLDRWKPDKDSLHEVQLVCAFNKMFYVTRKIQNGFTFWCMTHIGPDSDAKQFSLNIECATQPTTKQYMNMIDICHPFSMTSTQVIENGLCIGIPTNFFKCFKAEFRGIWYKVKICKESFVQDPERTTNNEV